MPSGFGSPPAPTRAPLAPLLALDTSTFTARVAVLMGAGSDGAGKVVAAGEAASARHASNLLRLCHEALGAAGLTVPELSGIVCGAGPGSFTGLRVGLAVAKGLALPFDLPLVQVSSLEALALDLAEAAAQSPAARALCPIVDAGKGQVYAALFRAPAGASTGAGEAAPLEALSPVWTVHPQKLQTALQAALAVLPDAPTGLVWGGPGAERYQALLQESLGKSFGESLGPRETSPTTFAWCAVAGPSAQAVGRLGLYRLRRGERDSLEAAVPFYGRPPDITVPKKPDKA